MRRASCMLCGETGRMPLRLRDGEVEAGCPECLEEEEGLWCALCGAPITEEDHALYVEPGVVEPVCEGCRGGGALAFRSVSEHRADFLKNGTG